VPKPATIDSYLAPLPADKREALAKLRTAIRAAAPEAEECISYGLPAFRQGGVLVGFGASAKHCALYLFSGQTVAAHAKELAGRDVSKGAVRFTPEKPLPATLVRRLVKARLTENAALRAAKRTPAKKAMIPGEDPGVAALLRDLDHPHKKDILAVRRIILGADPSISEGVKWNSVSFRTTDYFATVHLRSKNTVQLVFHRGAKAKAAKTMDVPDPEGMLKWLAPDRCLVTVGSGREIAARKTALEAVVRAWIARM
jgi:uncharacterized protein YdhG (YjbR/CyaY superfamily)